ncbi:hypothetical protein JTB14_010541 [Gonioctena quinquepunctata]|nr:hypothetical protein JTB14_010541 [Gonioctena quinquepunctata]
MRRLKEDNTLLQLKVREMEQIINTKEQKEKEGNVILAGIPKQEDEPKIIADKVFKAMKVEVKESDIQDIYRLTKRGDGPILIKLRNKELRLKLQEKIREIKAGSAITERDVAFCHELQDLQENDAAIVLLLLSEIDLHRRV